MVGRCSLDESNPTGQDDLFNSSWMIYLEISAMNKVTNDVVGVDVSRCELESSLIEDALTSLYSDHPNFQGLLDTMQLQFGSMYCARMLRFHARTGTMCDPLHTHLAGLVSGDKRPICTVLFQFMKVKGAETADLTTCLRLLLELDYVQMQVTKKHVNKLLLRAQQLLRVSSTDQVKKFIYEYNLYPMRKAVREVFMHAAGNYFSRTQSSGLPSGLLSGYRS